MAALLWVIAGLGGCSDSSSDDPTPTDGGVGEAAASVVVTVVYNGKSTAVDLSKPTPVTLSGAAYARLSDVLALGVPGAVAANLKADFEAGDGFRPNKSKYCKTMTSVPATALSKGYVQVTTRNLKWDDSLKYPGCMGVKNMAKLLIFDK